MDAKTMSGFIGIEVKLRTNNLLIAVRIINAKRSYGKTRFEVTPIAGSGTTWVERDSLVGIPMGEF